jgi:ribosomal protein S17
MFKIGDTVNIEESKPYSKNKRFKVIEENRWSKFKQSYL